MTEKFEIVINPDSYIWKNGKIDRFGDICIKLSNYYFPSKQWNDFGSDIVYWWMQSFLKLLDETDKEVKCSFMDGNYRFDVSVLNLELWRIKCIRESAGNDEIWHETNVDVRQAVTSVIKTAEVFQSLIHKAGETLAAENYGMRIKKLYSFL